MRSIATQPATTTRPRFCRALQQHNRRQQHGQRCVMRSIATQPAATTRPTVLNALRSNTPAATTRPTVLLRSLATPPATTTQPTASDALCGNTTGNDNTANGVLRSSNNTWHGNTANGVSALLQQHNRQRTTRPAGFDALHNNTTGSSNIALGFQRGSNLTTGSNNIDIGNARCRGRSPTPSASAHNERRPRP